MKKLFVLALGLVITFSSFAQSKFNVSGSIIEKSTNEAIAAASVQMYSLPDSAYVSGIPTSELGAFRLTGVRKGKYTLKISYIGYVTKYVDVDLTNKKSKDVNLGYITLVSDALMLQEAQVTANASKVKVSGDSIIFNASAYRTPEGSTLEALVKKLPGAKVDSDGKITINGKEVKKIMLDGKEFFLNDTEAAMKNIPVDIIESIKTYDKKSDLARVTGIDDGEDETVLDLSVKKGMNQGWAGQLNLGAGTQHRYNTRMNVNRFASSNYLSIIGGMNNVGDMGFGGGGGRGWGGWGGGLRANKNIGLSFATETDKLETGGSVRFTYNGSDNRNESSTESFVTKSGAFSESLSQSYSSNINFNTQFRFEWKPDTMTNVMFRPSYTYSRNRGSSYSSNASFNQDPNDYTSSPLDSIDVLIGRLDSIVVNTNDSRSQTYSENNNFNGMLQFNKRLNDSGRNVTLRINGGVSNGESKQISAANIHYYTADKDEDINNRYYNTPTRSRNFSAQATYSEPIANKTYLQFSYQFSYNYNKNDRQSFIYDSTTDAYNDLKYALIANRYDIDAILRYMDEQGRIIQYWDSLSQFSEYKTYQHTASVSFRKVTDKANFSIGIDLVPISTKLNYQYLAKVDTVISKNQFNFAPRIDFRYNFDKMTQLRVNYWGRMSQPSLTNLIDIRDDSDPLNITLGNPQLKPSFSHTMRGNFNTYNVDTQRSFFAYLNAGLTQNSISNIVEYDEKTGVRTTKPENINGNWNAGGGFGFNTPLDQANKFFTMDAFTNLNYSNSVGYNSTDNQTVKATTKSLGVGENVSVSYRRSLIEISLNGNVNYSHSKNDVTTSGNLDTWDFGYGAEFQYTTPFGLTLNTDIGMSSRRGYSSSEMNTNELLWNAQLSQTLFGGSLSVVLEVNDILGQQNNISRTINAMMRSDSRTNSIYQYGMLRIVYKFSAFGGKSTFGGRGHGGPGGFGGGFGGPMGRF